MHADAATPERADAFIRRTFAAMVAAVRDPAVQAGMIEPMRFDAGIAALHRSAEGDGAFCYTVFKAVAVR